MRTRVRDQATKGRKNGVGDAWTCVLPRHRDFVCRAVLVTIFGRRISGKACKSPRFPFAYLSHIVLLQPQEGSVIKFGLGFPGMKFSKNPISRRWLVVRIGLPLCGLLVIWLPWVLAGAHRNMIDGMHGVSLPLLIALGAVSGIKLRLNSALIGLLTVSALPIIAIIGAIIYPDTHNLLGLEIVMYGFLALPGALGSFLGKALSRCQWS
jgi:hypothetical protein